MDYKQGERKSLLEKNEEPERHKPKRRFIVEPMLILYTLAGFPMASCMSQILYMKVAESIGIPLANGSSVPDTYCVKGQNNVSDPNSGTTTDVNSTDLIQQAATEFSMRLTLADFLPSIILRVLYGAYSDKFGRKFTFIMPCIGAILQSAYMIAFIKFDLPLNYFYINLLFSIFGTMYTMLLGSYAYLADTTSKADRAVRMIVLDVLISVFGSLIDLATGYFISALGIFWPFLFVIGAKLLTILYIVFLVPETVVRSPGKRFSFDDILTGFKLYLKDNGTGRRWKLCLISSVYLVDEFFNGVMVLSLFLKNVPLCWGPILLAWYSAARMIVHSFGALLGGAMSKRKVVADIWLAFIGRMSSSLWYFYIPFVQTTVMMFLSSLISIFAVMPVAIIRAIMSNLVRVDEQGSLMAALSVISSICGLSSTLSVNPVYKNTLSYMPGLVFLISGGVHCISLMLLGLYIFKTRSERRKVTVLDVDSKSDVITHIQDQNNN